MTSNNEHAGKSSVIEVLYQASISSLFPQKSAYDAKIFGNLVKAFHLSIIFEVTVPSTKLMVISNSIDDRICYLCSSHRLAIWLPRSHIRRYFAGLLVLEVLGAIGTF